MLFFPSGANRESVTIVSSVSTFNCNASAENVLNARVVNLGSTIERSLFEQPVRYKKIITIINFRIWLLFLSLKTILKLITYIEAHAHSLFHFIIYQVKRFVQCI